MQKMSVAVKNEIIEYVSESFVNILQTLFILRKWDKCPDEDTIEGIISSYLQGSDDRFWSKSIADHTNVKNEKMSSEISTDIVRYMVSRVDMRKRSKNEITSMFNSLESFMSFMEKREPELKRQENDIRKRGLKTAKATVFARNIREKPVPAKIGPPTRSYSSSLTEERVKDRLLYWSEHEDELYRG